jgi:surfactin synthase thioesterase subunit
VTRTAPDRWLRLPADTGPASLTLVCVPHAGAGASSFARWPVCFGPDVRMARVQLPGREDVSDEPLLRRVDDAVAGLGPGLVRLARCGPLALYGHSMGALVAYELARALTAVGLAPAHLAVSGRRAPHLPARHPLLHHLPDDEFLAGLDAMAAAPRCPAPPPRTPAQTRYALRVTRADLALGEEYRHVTPPVLTCPVSAFGGLDDPVVDADEVDAWHAVTRGPFRARLLPGGHFFHQQARGAIADALRADRLDAREVETGVARPA